MVAPDGTKIAVAVKATKKKSELFLKDSQLNNLSKKEIRQALSSVVLWKLPKSTTSRFMTTLNISSLRFQNTNTKNIITQMKNAHLTVPISKISFPGQKTCKGIFIAKRKNPNLLINVQIYEIACKM